MIEASMFHVFVVRDLVHVLSLFYKNFRDNTSHCRNNPPQKKLGFRHENSSGLTKQKGRPHHFGAHQGEKGNNYQLKNTSGSRIFQAGFRPIQQFQARQKSFKVVKPWLPGKRIQNSYLPRKKSWKFQRWRVKQVVPDMFVPEIEHHPWKGWNPQQGTPGFQYLNSLTRQADSLFERKSEKSTKWNSDWTNKQKVGKNQPMVTLPGKWECSSEA